MTERALLVLLAASLVTSAPAFAQSGDAIIDRCRGVEDTQARIACLEAAVLALTATDETTDVAPAGEPDPANEVEQVPTVTAPVAQATVPVVPVAPERESKSADGNVDDEAVVIGAEQVAAQNQSREERMDSLAEARGLEVEKFETVGYRQLQVHLKNGQVWRQIRGDVQNIRVDVERNPAVDIVESEFGGYRLHLNGISRIIRVRRVR